MVGDDQMPPPAGPYDCTPSFVFERGLFGSTVYVFHSTLPVFASSAVTLPRKVQHSYLLFAPMPSSPMPCTGTYMRPSNTTGAPVTPAAGCVSTRVVQICLPVCASSAYALARWSPKNTAVPDLPSALV